MGLLTLAADKVLQIFGFRKHKRQKFSTFLRVEVCVNRLKDLGLNKSLENLKCLRKTLAGIADRFADFEAQALNLHVDLPLFQRLALPVVAGKSKIPGIRIHDTRMLRLMETLLPESTQIQSWRTAEIHQAIARQFGLTAAYTLTQLRYDLRKLKVHGLLEREGKRYRYRLTNKGARVALMFVLFHQRVCGPEGG